jgi:hypothetical protein
MRDRGIVALRGPEPGPTLVGVGAMHGNEPAGVEALVRIGTRIRAAGGLRRGAFVGLVGNRKALATGRRFVDRDLNRIWGLPPEGTAPWHEGREREELTRILGRIQREGRGPLHVVDLHTTSGRGPAFTIVPASPWGQAEADALPVPRIRGLFHSLPGTFGAWLDAEEIPNLILEGGSHQDPASVDRTEAVLRILLERMGLVEPRWLAADEARALLAGDTRGLPPLVEVRHRHPIEPADDFRMLPGFRNLQWVREGTRLGRDARGDVTAPLAGWLLLPLYQRHGEEGFLLGETVATAPSPRSRGPVPLSAHPPPG